MSTRIRSVLKGAGFRRHFLVVQLARGFRSGVTFNEPRVRKTDHSKEKESNIDPDKETLRVTSYVGPEFIEPPEPDEHKKSKMTDYHRKEGLTGGEVPSQEEGESKQQQQQQQQEDSPGYVSDTRAKEPWQHQPS